MKQLSTIDKKEMRARVIDLVENNMPRLIRLPPHPFVREAAWFCRSRFKARPLCDVVKVFALPLYKMGVFSGKLPAALKLFQAEEARLVPGIWGLSATSGNFGKDETIVFAMSDAAGFEAVVDHGTQSGKIKQMEAFGAKVTVAPQGVAATDYVRELAKDPQYILLDQYTRDETVQGHEWTVNHIVREMDRLRAEGQFRGFGRIDAAVTGTCSTLMALGRYDKRRFEDRQIRLLGVASMNKKEKVPGSRSLQDIAELERINGFFYRAEFEGLLDFDIVTGLTRDHVYRFNIERIRQTGEPVGPTSALLEDGVYRRLEESVEADRLDDLANEYGEIVIVMVWIDSNHHYLVDNDDPEYFNYFRTHF